MISTIDEDVSTAAGRSRYVARGAEILSHVSDGVIFDNCVKLLALESLSSLSTVREAVGKVDEVSDNFSLADPDDDGTKRKRQAPKKVPKKHSSQACNRFS